MNILVVNASPKGEMSNTLHITHAFLDGLEVYGPHDVTVFMVRDKKIEFCRGCFHCWNTKDGTCIFQDDMLEYTRLYRAADMVIFNTPVYYFGPPAILKNLFDRTLPFHVPEIVDRDNGGQRHEYRWDVGGKKIVLIATCGFYSYENNVEPLVKLFDICYGENCEKIICPEGTLFSLEVFRDATRPYLEQVRKAGEEMALNGCISEETRRSLVQRTFGAEDYLLLANNYWIQTDDQTTEEEKQRITIRQRIRQMPTLFHDCAFKKSPCVIEMSFPRINYECQMHLGSTEKKVVEDKEEFLPYHLRLFMDADQFITVASKHTGNHPNGPERGALLNPRKLADLALRLQEKGISRDLHTYKDTD